MKRRVAAAIAASALAAALVAAVMLMSRTVVVDIINEGTTPDAATFEPGTISVQLGTTVVWKNTDASAHTVTSRTGVFDSGVMGPEEEFQFTFESQGTFEYYCKIHPVMVGGIQVQ